MSKYVKQAHFTLRCQAIIWQCHQLSYNYLHKPRLEPQEGLTAQPSFPGPQLPICQRRLLSWENETSKSFMPTKNVSCGKARIQLIPKASPCSIYSPHKLQSLKEIYFKEGRQVTLLRKQGIKAQNAWNITQTNYTRKPRLLQGIASKGRWYFPFCPGAPRQASGSMSWRCL